MGRADRGEGDQPVIVVSAFLVGAAVWWWPAPTWRLYRVIDQPTRARGQARWLRSAPPADDPFVLAAALDLMAVCLLAGLPVAAAARVAAEDAPESLATPLRGTAELLELGSDPEIAWAQLEVSSRRGLSPVQLGGGRVCFNELATMARRSARAGSALSRGVLELSAQVRREAHDAALARAERAGVLISGPLGLCFLPAFICLGIVPVVIGLAAQTLGGM